MNRRTLLLLLSLLLLPALPAAGACDAALPAALQPAPLQQVLARRAAAQPFRLEYWAQDNPAVLQPAGSPAEVVALLAREANLVVRYAPHPGCPGALRVEAVWVLPTGQAAPVPRRDRPASPAPRSATAAATPVPPAQPVQPTATVDDYLRAHGIAPPAAAASAR